MQENIDAITWYQKPRLKDPVFVAAFEGWNDAGEAASDSVAWLVDNYDSQLIAEIEGDEFFDYQAIRPNITVGEGNLTEISWPRNRVYSIKVPEAQRDIVAFLSHEPNYKWRSFCSTVLEVVDELKCKEVFTFGSLMAEVPHTRPIRLSAMCLSKDKIEALEVIPSNYDGPTGIVGVIHEHFASNKKEAVSLWATIPHYVAQRPQPAAITELLNTFAALIGVDFDTGELASEAAEWVAHVNDAVEQDDQALEYVSHLEDGYDNGTLDEDYELADEEFPTADDLADEVEKFLRDQPPEQ